MYLARDLELGIFRAVKELPISNRREAGLLRLLEHPAKDDRLCRARRILLYHYGVHSGEIS